MQGRESAALLVAGLFLSAPAFGAENGEEGPTGATSRRPIVPDGAARREPAPRSSGGDELLSPSDVHAVLSSQPGVATTLRPPFPWKRRWPFIPMLAGSLAFAATYGANVFVAAHFASPGWAYRPVYGGARAGIATMVAAATIRGYQAIEWGLLGGELALLELVDAALQLAGLVAVSVGVVKAVSQPRGVEHATSTERAWRVAVVPAFGGRATGVSVGVALP